MTEVTPDTRAEAQLVQAGPKRIGVSGWFAIILRVLQRTKSSGISLIAAGVAFYALFAAFPAIAAIMALAGLFTEPERVVSQLQEFTDFLPEDAGSILIKQANAVAGSSDEGLSLTLWLGVGFAVYLSTRATASIIHGLNIAFQADEDRGFFAYWVTVVLLTTAILFSASLLLLLLVGLPTFLAFVPLDLGTEQIIRSARWIAVMLVFMAGLASLYHWGPAGHRPHRRWFSAGAVLAVVLWVAGSYGFAIYVSNFGNYNETFGSLGGVIILLTWLWLSGFIVLLGALLDAEIEREQGRHEPEDL